ncbi:glycosyltransferase family 9 protein [Pontibacter sp. H259]|uniref:glycosyltransferase family 9 protein n=1 Tax=Pontibacter sp. H259 TaxID=3133421 RepID=UPI0030BA9644
MQPSEIKKILVIQTAFLGDVVLATALIEKLHTTYPNAQLDFLLRKGNEGLLKGHPLLEQVLIWNKLEGKYKSLWKLLRQIRSEKYDVVVNVQRYGATGILTAFSGAKQTFGFDKNPFSRFFTRRYTHNMKNGSHEVERNQLLISSITEGPAAKPKLYPSEQDYEKVQTLKPIPYITIAPTSVWFTKQYPAEKWVDLLNSLPANYKIYLLGSPADKVHAEAIMVKAQHPNMENLCGQLNLLQSAALMRDAVLNYVNDSGPMHLASSVNAPTCAVYCSTVPRFGYGPLADFAMIVEKEEPLYCRPCGLHGYKACPEGHFKCAHDIWNEQLLHVLEMAKV